jgi:AcrR family transcriptional regulator
MKTKDVSELSRVPPSATRKKAIADTAKLDKTAWIEQALHVLATGGVDAVRVEILAKNLGVTKGSFYWHFKDRSDLLEGLLHQWRRRATLAIIERLEGSHDPPERRLQRLLRLQFEARRAEAGAEVELSVRLWGRRDERALAALKEIDQLRLRYIAGLLEEMGLDKAEADARAVLAYSYMRVSRSLVPAEDKAMLQLCEKVILGRPSR